jgi:beta-lactam-binding protein with PASTA domain
MRARRHTSSGPLLESAAWRAFLRDIGLIALTFAVGYIISVVWLSPGTVFTKDHSLPRVLELSEAEARQALTELGFRPRLDGERHSDAFSRGTVI